MSGARRNLFFVRRQRLHVYLLAVALPITQVLNPAAPTSDMGRTYKPWTASTTVSSIFLQKSWSLRKRFWFCKDLFTYARTSEE